jgi:uncharacterized protein YfaS (alpha-2-macroglobulin family)
MKAFLLGGISLVLSLLGAVDDPAQFYAQKSYAQAAELWQKQQEAEKPERDSARGRELAFRVADAQWRALSATEQRDETVFEPSLKVLRGLAAESTDQWGAEANESLGDFQWLRSNWSRPGLEPAREFYRRALDFWAKQDAAEPARQRYLGIVFRALNRPRDDYYRNYYQQLWPVEVTENAVQLAKTKEEKAQAHLLRAVALVQSGGGATPARAQQIRESFTQALLAGRTAEWYDDALWRFAQWLETQGRVVEQGPGRYILQPDYAEAAKLYQRLVTEFSKGESRWRDDAQNRLKEITEPQIEVNVGNAFFPESPIELALSARNVEKVELTIYRLDLAKVFTVKKEKTFNRYDRRNQGETGKGEKVRSWTETTPKGNPHEPLNKMVRTEALPPGAYWVEGQAGTIKGGSILLVTATTVNYQQGKDRLLVFVCDAMTGEPRPGAQVQVLRYYHQNSGDEGIFGTVQGQAEGDQDGVAIVPAPALPENANDQGLVLIAQAGDQPALLTQSWFQADNRRMEQGKTYVYTDRPAYRPEDTVQFKLIHRRYDGAIYGSAAGQKIKLRVDDPRGTKLLEKSYTLNEFGSVADSFPVPKDAALGVYTLALWIEKDGETVYSVSEPLFRIEEYKLPEFRVTVKMPEKEGKAQTFRKGDKVKAVVQVEYYSGGPVPNAEVNYDLYQSPYYGDNPWPQPYPWYYRDFQGSAPWMSFWRPNQGGNMLKRDVVKTDAAGRAEIVIETPDQQAGLDWEYRIEARVSDASRREVRGEGRVKVTEAPFRFYLKPVAQVYAPGSTLQVEVKALDANNGAQKVKATAIITRETYVRKTRKIKKTGIERVTFQGYDAQEVSRQDVETDATGRVRISCKVTEAGFYRVKIMSPPFTDKNKGPAPERVMGETTLFVADASSRDLGYRLGQLQIFPDKQTYRVGETAKLVVIAPQDGGTTLLTVLGDDLLTHRVVRMEGTAKLVEIPVTEAFQPNIFFQGLMVRDSRVMVATEEAVVPPEEHFLKVEVRPDAGTKRPGEAGSQRVSVTDAAGQPVRAELSLGVIDASIYYIQSEMAGDIREFFFGEKRALRFSPQSMLNELALRKILPPEEEEDEVVQPGAAGEWGMDSSRQERGRRNYAAESEGRMDYEFKKTGVTTAPMASRQETDSLAAATGDALGGGNFRGKEMLQKSRTDKGGERAGEKPLEEAESPLVVRSDFRATAFWDSMIRTDEKGQATVKLTYPESLTEWKTVARAVTAGVQFGFGEATVQTRQPIMVRLQTPRFLVERDQVTLSAVVNNESDKEASVEVTLTAQNLEAVDTTVLKGSVSAHGQKRFDRVYRVKANRGSAEVTATAKSLVGNDAMKRSVPIVEHGLEKFVAKSFVLSAGEKTAMQQDFVLDLPAQRNPGTTSLKIQLAPSLASTCLDALPYLVRYPYGCVEQTMSRFLPAVITAKTLKDLGLEPEVVAGRLFGGIEKDSPDALKMRKGDLTQLDDLVKKGLERLADFQHGDGGWGWWKQGESDDFMTAYVVQGLALGRQAGVEVDENRLNQGAAFLRTRLVEHENDPSLTAWMLYAIALTPGQWNEMAQKAANRVWENREQLNAYSRSLLALAFKALEKEQPEMGERAKVLVLNLENGVVVVKADSAVIEAEGSAISPVTCHWGEDGVAYRWSDGGVEATAMALRAILAIEPNNPRVHQAARWLINNRRGAQWKNTRDTAIVVLSLLEYMKQTKEIDPDLSAQIVVNGREWKKTAFTAQNALGTSELEIPESALKTGTNLISLRAHGRGRLYAAASLKYFTKEEPITAAGNEIYVKREYYRETTQPMLLGGTRLVKTLLRDGDTLKSGDRIEVRLLVEAKNNYEYLLFEDKKPAGCEAVEVQSGEGAWARAQQADGKFEGESTFIYQEWRDQHVASFISQLKAGVHEIRYMLRAETPGQFHALPVKGHAMYVPEIRANSDETRFTVKD